MAESDFILAYKATFVLAFFLRHTTHFPFLYTKKDMTSHYGFADFFQNNRHVQR